MTIAAIYSRKSTDQNGVADEQKSVARQVEHAREYAARKGWTVDEGAIFIDDGISGAEFSKRPGFLRLMNALKPRPSFQVLVMSEESRLGREAIETAYALKQLLQAGVRVFFYLEDRERTFDSPTDKLLMSVAAFADEMEREKARQRTADAMVRKAKAGHVTGGRVFGYDNVEVLMPTGQRSHVERQINRGRSRGRRAHLRALRRRPGRALDHEAAERRPVSRRHGRSRGVRRLVAVVRVGDPPTSALSRRGRLEPERRSGTPGGGSSSSRATPRSGFGRIGRTCASCQTPSGRRRMNGSPARKKTTFAEMRGAHGAGPRTAPSRSTCSRAWRSAAAVTVGSACRRVHMAAGARSSTPARATTTAAAASVTTARRCRWI